MKITVFGAGYVGLTLGIGLAGLGNDVICVDVDETRVKALTAGKMPIYEPGAEELLKRNLKEKRLTFTTDAAKAIAASTIIFIAVGTPGQKDGSCDLSFVDKVAETIGKHLDSFKVIVNKSTVPVGTAERVQKGIAKHLRKKVEFAVVSNPEFLREGSAIKDFMNPDRIILGVEDKKARALLVKLYKPLERSDKPIFVTSIRTAELIKYASNSFLATKISFINEIANLSEKVGADVKDVARGMGLDKRIGSRFLQAGVGYGGSCFPKDVKALTHIAAENNYDFKILHAVEKVNAAQKLSLLPKIKNFLGSIKDKKIAIWGLAFKPRTDDIREASALEVIQALQKEGAVIAAFDPVAQGNAQKVLKGVSFGQTPYEVIKDADCLVIMTEWDTFKELDKDRMKSLMKTPVVVDGRNIYEPSEMKALGFQYAGVGRGA